jgi:riboflavin kinase / FMN adenylyltransferase
MQLLNKIEDLVLVHGPVYVAIGVFDGVHLGHQAVISGAVRRARQNAGGAVVITFDPHPIRVLRPEKAPRILMTPINKRRAIEELGVDALLTVSFTPEFAKTSPELFVQRLSQNANDLREIWIGEGWRFGANRAGGVNSLELIAESLGIKVNAVPAVLVNDQVVSSSWIRAAMEQDQVDQATLLLGRPSALEYLRPTRLLAGPREQAARAVLWAELMLEMERQVEDRAQLNEFVF